MTSLNFAHTLFDSALCFEQQNWAQASSSLASITKNNFRGLKMLGLHENDFKRISINKSIQQNKLKCSICRGTSVLITTSKISFC